MSIDLDTLERIEGCAAEIAAGIVNGDISPREGGKDFQVGRLTHFLERLLADEPDDDDKFEWPPAQLVGWLVAEILEGTGHDHQG